MTVRGREETTGLRLAEARRSALDSGHRQQFRIKKIGPELSIAQSRLPSGPFPKTYVARLLDATATPAASSELSTASPVPQKLGINGLTIKGRFSSDIRLVWRPFVGRMHVERRRLTESRFPVRSSPAASNRRDLLRRAGRRQGRLARWSPVRGTLVCQEQATGTASQRHPCSQSPLHCRPRRRVDHGRNRVGARQRGNRRSDCRASSCGCGGAIARLTHMGDHA